MKDALKAFRIWWVHYMRRPIEIRIPRLPTWAVALLLVGVVLALGWVYRQGMKQGQMDTILTAYDVCRKVSEA